MCRTLRKRDLPLEPLLVLVSGAQLAEGSAVKLLFTPPDGASGVEVISLVVRLDRDATAFSFVHLANAEAKRLGVEGQVKVRLKIDAGGNVAGRSLVTRLGHGLDELALKLAGRLRFKPAIATDDRPVPATVVWTFTFTLPR